MYLVGGFNPSEKYWSVGIIIPHIWKKMFQTTNQVPVMFVVRIGKFNMSFFWEGVPGYPFPRGPIRDVIHMFCFSEQDLLSTPSKQVVKNVDWDFPIHLLVNIQKTMERSTIFHG